MTRSRGAERMRDLAAELPYDAPRWEAVLVAAAQRRRRRQTALIACIVAIGVLFTLLLSRNADAHRPQLALATVKQQQALGERGVEARRARGHGGLLWKARAGPTFLEPAYLPEPRFPPSRPRLREARTGDAQVALGDS
jgi:hypothetical protein